MRASSRGIWSPKVTQAPKDRAEIGRPVEPKRRYCMRISCCGPASGPGSNSILPAAAGRKPLPLLARSVPLGARTLLFLAPAPALH
ncbi:hypothetical protein SMG44B_30123 [Stenotrophomonas maltophilia]|nr:hypothetical protein BN126320204 [Stenotrophomonas maltophilia]